MEHLASDELTMLAVKYGSDKAPQFLHNYTPYYHRLMGKYRQTFKKVVELGVGTSRVMKHMGPEYIPGASLRMWRDYFPNAEIYGIDKAEEAMIENEPRIHTVLCDVRRKTHLRQMLNVIGTDADMFLDDGSHDPHEQASLCLWLMRRFRKDIMYIIEDVRDWDVRAVADAIKSGGYAVGFPHIGGRRRGRVLTVRKPW